MDIDRHIELLTSGIRRAVRSLGRGIKIMEVCGTHTVAIFRHGIRALLPEDITLLSGPGCPVCVTSIEDVDRAIALSLQRGVILATFGDMMRVPGARLSLYHARSEGAGVVVVYSPMDCLETAKRNPDRDVIFFGTGFETTSPSVAATLVEADNLGIENLYLYSCHKLVPPALRALLEDSETEIDGFILPGHVSTIIGSGPYEFIASEYKVPSVITGFEGPDILEGILMILDQLLEGRAEVQIQYRRVVRPEGNPRAVELIERVFRPADTHWRGIGTIPRSGLDLREEFTHRNARVHFPVEVPRAEEPKGCRCGDVLRGKRLPPECPLFGRKCTPEHPVGACMVSTEGSCAAYYRYSGLL